MREKWEVSYSRFLNIPSPEATVDADATCPYMQVRRATKICKEKGTWLTASSLAELKLLVDFYNADVVMRVEYGGRVMEEHFVSKVNISWPQVSCEAGFPPRGTRVVTVTYKDEVEEVQKFAFRFSTICSLETFLNALKVYMKDARKTLHANYSSRSDVSTPQSYRPLIDFYSRTPLTSMITQDYDTCSKELASISNFNKRRFTSEKFYQQAVVEDLRASSFRKLTTKPVHEKTMKRTEQFSQNLLESRRFTSIATSEADNDSTRALCARSQEKETADHQSKMLISVDESIHIGKEPTGNRIDLRTINESNQPITWHKSSEAVTEDSSLNRNPTISNHETDVVSNTQNLVPSSSGVEIEQGKQQRDASNNNLNSLEAFPPSFSTLLSNCVSSSGQAATPQSPKFLEDDLKSQIARYIEDSTFQDMLMKVEKVIDELGYVDALDG